MPARWLFLPECRVSSIEYQSGRQHGGRNASSICHMTQPPPPDQTGREACLRRVHHAMGDGMGDTGVPAFLSTSLRLARTLLDGLFLGTARTTLSETVGGRGGGAAG